MIDNATIAEGLRRLADYVDAGDIPARAYPEVPLSVQFVMGSPDDVETFALSMGVGVSVRQNIWSATTSLPGVDVSAFWMDKSRA